MIQLWKPENLKKEETKMLNSDSIISPGSITLYRFTNPAYRRRASCKPQSPRFLFFSQILLFRTLRLNRSFLLCYHFWSFIFINDHFTFVLAAINAASLLMKRLASGAIPPVVVNTRGTNDPFSNCSTRFIYWLFFSFSCRV